MQSILGFVMGHLCRQLPRLKFQCKNKFVAYVHLKLTCSVTTPPINPMWQPATPHTVVSTHRYKIDPRELQATIRKVELLIKHPDAKDLTNINRLIVTHHNDALHYLNQDL
jgi:hypothetical protein